jgi:hypothetical protein
MDDARTAKESLQYVSQFFAGLGIFFVDIGVLCGVSVWDKKD